MNSIHSQNIDPNSKYPSVHLQSFPILPVLQVKQFEGYIAQVLH